MKKNNLKLVTVVPNEIKVSAEFVSVAPVDIAVSMITKEIIEKVKYKLNEFLKSKDDIKDYWKTLSDDGGDESLKFKITVNFTHPEETK